MKMNQKFVSSAIASTLVIGGLSFGVAAAANASASVCTAESVAAHFCDVVNSTPSGQKANSPLASTNSTSNNQLANTALPNDTFNDTRAAQGAAKANGGAAVKFLVKDENGNYLWGANGKDFVVPGEKVDYIIVGFKSGETVKLSLHSVVVDLGEKQADANGVIKGSFVVPADFTNGKHKFIAKGLEKTIELAFEVKEGKDAVEVNGGKVSGGAKLAETGSNVEFGAVAGAVALVLAGAGAFVARRRNA